MAGKLSKEQARDAVDSALLNGSIDLAWMLQAKPWQLRVAAGMLAGYFPMTATVLHARANRLDPTGTAFPIKAEPKQVM